MSRKWIYIGGAVIVALLLLIVLLPFVLDANQYRPRIESLLNGVLNRKVSIGNIRLSIFSGGITVSDISVADDPAFSSGAFLEAKTLTVGVELMPLIFSHALNVTAVSINAPHVTLLRGATGAWNFSTVGAAATKPEQTGEPGTAAQGPKTEVSVRHFAIKNGTVTVGDAVASGKRHDYEQVNVDASNLSYTTQFPFELSAKIGNGTLKLSGKAGPVNQADAQETPIDARLDVQGLDPASTGFVAPASGIGGFVDFTGSLTSDGQQMNLNGKASASRLKLVQGGSPAAVPVEVDFESMFDLRARSGALKQGDIHIGKAVAHLTGTYSTAGEAPSVQMGLNGENMPAADLEAMLPALGVILPSDASIKSGVVGANLTITGPVNRLVTSGPVSLANAKLAGFDLGSKLGALSSLAGVAKGADTQIQTLSADLRIDPETIRLDKLSLVVPGIGSIAGSGTIAASHALDFKMAARVGNSGSTLGGLASLVGGSGATGGIPFLIHGTTSNPIFEPDVNGMVGGLAKGALAGGSKNTPGVQNLGQALGGLFGKKKSP